MFVEDVSLKLVRKLQPMQLKRNFSCMHESFMDEWDLLFKRCPDRTLWYQQTELVILTNLFGYAKFFPSRFQARVNNESEQAAIGF